MMRPPTFSSSQAHSSSLSDVSFWQPYVNNILTRHDMIEVGQELTAGIGGTYPTFLIGNVVVKLFGYSQSWRKGYTSERAALRLIGEDPQLATPKLLAAGHLYEDDAAPWPYIVTSRVMGNTWQEAGLSLDQQLSVITDIGVQILRLHALPPGGAATHEDWSTLSVSAAAEHSSLPSHLIAQIDDYIAQLKPFDPLFVHGDLMHRHIFVEAGRLTGIIDWGDGIVTDRHYELAKLHLDLFNCDKVLLQTFLKASNWPVESDFAQKAMGQALHRQAHGLAQHPTMDVFHKLPALGALKNVASLDELAARLFAV